MTEADVLSMVAKSQEFEAIKVSLYRIHCFVHEIYIS